MLVGLRCLNFPVSTHIFVDCFLHDDFLLVLLALGLLAVETGVGGGDELL